MSNKQFLRSRCTFSCAGWNKNNIQRINASHCFYLQHSLVKQFEILVLCIRLYIKKNIIRSKKRNYYLYTWREPSLFITNMPRLRDLPVISSCILLWQNSTVCNLENIYTHKSPDYTGDTQILRLSGTNLPPPGTRSACSMYVPILSMPETWCNVPVEGHIHKPSISVFTQYGPLRWHHTGGLQTHTVRLPLWE